MIYILNYMQPLPKELNMININYIIKYFNGNGLDAYRLSYN